MKSAVAFTVLSVAAGVLAQDTPTMNTPSNLVACQPVQLSWKGGKPPYFISIQDGNNPGGAALFSFPEQSGTALTWTVNLQPGTSLTFLLRDSNGATSPTAPTPVLPGSSTDCIGKSASVSGGQTNTNTGAQGTGGSGGSQTTQTTGSNTSGSNTAGSPSQTSGGSSPTNSQGSSTGSNGATTTKATYAGVFGAALLALFA